MSLQFWSTMASIGTFVVIAATAVAALVQLRHLRSSNQIAALTEIRETLESNEFQEARRYVFDDLPTKLEDPAARKRLYQHPPPAEFSPLSRVGNLFENFGSFVRNGIIDPNVACDIHGRTIIDTWDKLSRYTAVLRRAYGKHLWENFEYLTVVSIDWRARHLDNRYPAGMRRLPLDETWVTADEEAVITPPRTG